MTSDFTGYSFEAGSKLPGTWKADAGIIPEKTPDSIKPAGAYVYGYRISSGAGFVSNTTTVKAGETYRITLTVARWTETEEIRYHVNLQHVDGKGEPIGLTVDSSTLPVGQWVSRSIDIPVMQTDDAYLMMWTDGVDTTGHLAAIQVRAVVGGAVSH